jgi:hypothetical protein
MDAARSAKRNGAKEVQKRFWRYDSN